MTTTIYTHAHAMNGMEIVFKNNDVAYNYMIVCNFYTMVLTLQQSSLHSLLEELQLFTTPGYCTEECTHVCSELTLYNYTLPQVSIVFIGFHDTRRDTSRHEN